MNAKEGSAFPAICVAAGLPRPVPEYKFHPTRKWRFDWYFEGGVALEIEGGAYHGHGHRSVGKFLRDMEKYNAAAIAGVRVLRCTVKEFNDGSALSLVKQAFDAQKDI